MLGVLPLIYLDGRVLPVLHFFRTLLRRETEDLNLGPPRLTDVAGVEPAAHQQLNVYGDYR